VAQQLKLDHDKLQAATQPGYELQPHTAVQDTIPSSLLPPLLMLLFCAHADALLAASPDFQTKLGYALPAPGGANLSTASKANAQKYNTLSLVLEQPFKDTIGEWGRIQQDNILHRVKEYVQELLSGGSWTPGKSSILILAWCWSSPSRTPRCGEPQLEKHLETHLDIHQCITPHYMLLSARSGNPNQELVGGL
jgi:hypothetical protein